MARTTLFTETFNGANQDPLSDAGAWTSKPSAWSGNMQRLASVARASLGNVQSAARCETAVAANQYAKATGVNADSGAVAIAGVCTRMQTDGSCYALYYYPNDSGGSLSLYRFDAGSFGSPLLRLAIGALVSNNTIELRSVGSRHFAFLNGKYLGSYEDTTGGAYATGKTGVACLDNGTGATIAYFEMGTSDGVIDEFPNSGYDLFVGNENPLSESAAWLIPTINAGSDATRHWVDGCQKLDYAATGRGAGHNMTYRSGTFNNDQRSIAVVDVGSFVGVVTRVRSNGDCYLAFQHSLNGDVELFKYQDPGDPGANPAEGFISLGTAAFSPTGGVLLLELYSSASNVHNVWVTNPGGVRTNIISNVSDASYLTGAPGIAPFGNALNAYAWLGGNQPSPSAGGDDPNKIHVGIVAGDRISDGNPSIGGQF